MPRAGDQVGPYHFIRELGRGQFGVVWLAEKRTAIIIKEVALKLPRDEDIELDLVKQEATIWAEASGHPNILPLIDADVYGNQVVIVSEYAPDGSLERWLGNHDGKAPTIESATELMMGILAGLNYLHTRQRPIIHRDLKPGNIMLQGESPRLADFGIARALKSSSSYGTASVSGTLPYMAPEAFSGVRSTQTDVWSAGVIFYRLLTGRLPFPQEDIAALLSAIMNREQEKLPSSVPNSVRAIVTRSLEKNPELRYKSADEMRRALRDMKPMLVDDTMRSPPPPVPWPIPPIRPPRPSDKTMTKAKERRRKDMQVIVIALFVLAVAVICLLALNSIINDR